MPAIWPSSAPLSNRPRAPVLAVAPPLSMRPDRRVERVGSGAVADVVVAGRFGFTGIGAVLRGLTGDLSGKSAPDFSGDLAGCGGATRVVTTRDAGAALTAVGDLIGAGGLVGGLMADVGGGMGGSGLVAAGGCGWGIGAGGGTAAGASSGGVVGAGSSGVITGSGMATTAAVAPGWASGAADAGAEAGVEVFARSAGGSNTTSKRNGLGKRIDHQSAGMPRSSAACRPSASSNASVSRPVSSGA